MKVLDGNTAEIVTVEADNVGDFKLIGDRMVEIVSKEGDTKGIGRLNGVFKVTKVAHATARPWAQFEKIYWKASDKSFTDDHESNANKEAGVAFKAAESTATEGYILLNGLPSTLG